MGRVGYGKSRDLEVTFSTELLVWNGKSKGKHMQNTEGSGFQNMGATVKSLVSGSGSQRRSGNNKENKFKGVIWGEGWGKRIHSLRSLLAANSWMLELLWS